MTVDCFVVAASRGGCESERPAGVVINVALLVLLILVIISGEIFGLRGTVRYRIFLSQTLNHISYFSPLKILFPIKNFLWDKFYRTVMFREVNLRVAQL